MNFTLHPSWILFSYSEELDRRTKETQRLQEEVENATKVTLERFGSMYGIHSSPGQCCHNHSFNVCEYNQQQPDTRKNNRTDVLGTNIGVFDRIIQHKQKPK